MGTLGLQVIVIFLLIVANGFFAASEIAIVSARRGRLQQRAEAGSHGAQVALVLAEEPNRFLATVQVGISLIGTFAAAFGGDVLADPLTRALIPVLGDQYAEGVALTLVVLGITYCSLIVGELVPKRLGLQNAEAVDTFVAPIMRRIAQIAAPIVWFLTISTQFVLRLLGRGTHQEEAVTEEDVMSLVREGTEGGTMDTAEQELIERVFQFSDCTARTIMTSRTEVFAISVDLPFDHVVQRVIEAGYSRIPVYRGSLDTIEGILYAKDVLRAVLEHHDPAAPPTLAPLLRPPVFVLEHQRIADVLRQFKQTRTHLALVLDEYGQIDGLVTLEDVLEELTGDIADEYDETEAPIVRRADGSFLVDGRLTYADAEPQVGLPDRASAADLPPFDTIAGLLLALLEHIPTAGETVTWQDWSFEVMDMDGVRIDKILVRPPQSLDAQTQTEGVLATRARVPGAQPENDPPPDPTPNERAP